MKKGIVYLVGAGPGSPDLITVKGMKILKQADVVIYDYLVGDSFRQFIKEEAEFICADFLGKHRFSDGFLKRQNLINRLILKKVEEGKNVVRLKNGDPFIFGRTSEELNFLLKNKIKFRVVPGVSSFNAAGCYLGIPLTDRKFSSHFTVLTGHEARNKSSYIDWSLMAKLDTLIVYMGVENINKISDLLIKSGKDKNTPVACISNISRSGQLSTSGKLKDIAEKVNNLKVKSPAVFIIGNVVNNGKLFSWLEKEKKVLFTGLSEERFFEDNLYFHIPLIEIKPLKDYSKFDFLIKKYFAFGKINFLVFTSRFGVYYFFERFFSLGFDARILKDTKIAAIGNSTSNKLKEYGIIADILPKRETSKGLLEEFKKIAKKSTTVCNLSIFMPRSDIADKGLTKELKNIGFKVISVIAYRNVIPKNLPEIDLNFFDEIFFTSPSTVRNFIKKYGRPPDKINIKTIGKVTEKEARKWNLID